MRSCIYLATIRSGDPWKTQKRIREVMRKLYSAAPDGYCGDEDNGQTSAWYVFSAMGFYPVCPGSGEYAIGSPLFRRMTVDAGNGRKIEITSDGGDGRNAPYISSMSVNGTVYTKNYVTHEELAAGAKIKYKMAAEPETLRGNRSRRLSLLFFKGTVVFFRQMGC